MVCLVYLKMYDGAVVHLVFQVVLGHEASDEVPQVVLGYSDFQGDVGDHQPPHLLGVDQGRGGHVGRVVYSGHPREGVPKLPVIVVLVFPVII